MTVQNKVHDIKIDPLSMPIEARSEVHPENKYFGAFIALDDVRIGAKALMAVSQFCETVANAANGQGGLVEMDAENLCCLIHLIHDHITTACDKGQAS